MAEGCCQIAIEHESMDFRSQRAENGNVHCVQGSTVNVGERDSQRFLASLQKTESSAGRYPPGSLLLAQDPNDLNR